MFQLGLAPLGNGHRDVGIELSPDKLERNFQRLEFRQTPGVLGKRAEELRSQLHKRWPRAGLNEEIVADQRPSECAEMGLLCVRKRGHELLLLPLEQPAE